MAYQSIGRGSAANDGTGDDLRTGAGKVNDNFVELYTLLGDGSTLSSDPVVTEAATQTLTNKTITGTFTGNITGNVTGQVSDVSNHDTDDIAEGATNQYYTDARADARVTAGIGAASITDLSDADQGVATTDSPTFVAVTADLTGDVTGNVAGNVSGNVDGIVGGTTPAAGSFTTVSLSDALQLAVFADGTARDAAITVPAAGMLCFVTDNGSAVSKAQVYDGSAWVDLH